MSIDDDQLHQYDFSPTRKRDAFWIGVRSAAVFSACLAASIATGVGVGAIIAWVLT